MIRVDFHVHTDFSLDSTIKVRGLAEKAKRLGIIPVIADHNTMAAVAQMKKEGVRFIPGEEIRTDAGDLIGLFLNEEIKARITFEDAIERIKGQGGLSYLPHMYDSTRYGCSDEALAAKADIIEGLNARCVLDGHNERAMEFAKRHGKPVAAGSDAHFLFEFGKTYVEMPEFDIDDPPALLKALRSGKARIFGEKSPFYVHGTTSVVKFLRKAGRKLGLRKDIK